MNEELDIGQSATLTDLAMCINHYRLSTPGLYVCVHVPVQLDPKTRITPGLIAQVNYGKFKQCDPGKDYQYFTGPPNFVLDVFKDGEEEAYQNRKRLFEQAGVLEYVVWQGSSDKLVWHRLVDDRFQEVRADKEGLIKSSALPGLWLLVDAAQQRDWWDVMAKITEGITRKEHHDFMASIWKP